MDYCIVYLDKNRYAEQVLNEIQDQGGSVVTSSSAKNDLNDRIADRQRLLDYLINEASRCISEESNPVTAFSSGVLNYPDLQTASGVSFNSSHLPDLSGLAEHLENVGIHEFRNDLDDWRIQANHLRKNLYLNVIDDTYEKGGQSQFTLAATLSSASRDQCQVECLVNAAYWCQSHGDSVLVSNECGVYEERERISKAMSQIANSDIDMVSPMEIVEDMDII
ncbi:hypothetical protein [Natrinema altunense]|uniref:hypothetical protein n=1 Tax=Natrinema altunense TaxID=222984 RepID=UPI0011847D32|nr:hypothetical protein [Natrinema altunense]